MRERLAQGATMLVELLGLRETLASHSDCANTQSAVA